MAHDPRKLLFDIIDACNKVTEFTAGLSFEQFTSSDLVKSAVHMQFIIIGEALMRLRATDSVIYDNIPEADRTIAFRNVIAHGYDVIVDEIVGKLFKRRYQSCSMQPKGCSSPKKGSELTTHSADFWAALESISWGPQLKPIARPLE
jgi:uncharacterized protein with HEPN domain